MRSQKSGGSGASRRYNCFSCDEKAVNYQQDYGGHSLGYCLDCYTGCFEDSDDFKITIQRLDLTKDELIILIVERIGTK